MWHSAFVKWLLDPQSHLGLGDFPLKRFVFAVMNSATDESEATVSAGLTLGDIEDMNLTEMAFATEFTDLGLISGGGGKARIDIIGSCESIHLRSSGETTSMRLIIENKIKALESTDQTLTYYNYARRSTENFAHDILIFLTPTETQKPKCEQFRQITYQDLCDLVIKPCLQHPGLPEESRYLLEQYLVNLGKPLKGGRTMALPNKEICQRIYDAHREVLEEIFVSVKGEAPRPAGAKTTIHSSNVTLEQLVNNNLLSVSDELYFTYRSATYLAIVEKREAAIVIVYNGTAYSSPSSAASAVTGKSANGWAVWNVRTAEGCDKGSLSELRQKLPLAPDEDA